MGRGIDITLGLRDNLSGALKSAVTASRGQLDSLQKRMDGMKGPSLGSGSGGPRAAGGQESGSVFSQVLGANLVGDALSNIASGVLQAGQALIGAIGDQFKASEEANRGALGATSANAALLGMTFQDSAKMTASISKTLAQSAQTLPGATKDYLDAFNGVSDTLSLSGGLTKKGMTDAGREMVELVALLGKASGSGSGTTSTVIGKMLGDTGSEALFRIDAFEKVPAFKALLEKDLEKAGKTLKDFFKMDAKAKQEQLVGVKKQLFSKDYIEQMNLSMGSQMDKLSAQFSDPTSGIFGFMREVKFEGGNTTVLKELGKTFSVLTATAAEIVGSMGGLSLDPMVLLVGGLRNLSSFAKDPAAMMPSVINGFVSGLGSIFKFILDIPQKLLSGVGAGLMSMAADGAQVQLITAQVTSGIIGWVTNAMNSLAANGGNMEGIFGVLLGGFALIGNVALGILYGVAGALPGLLGSLGNAIVVVWGSFEASIISAGGLVLSALGDFFGAMVEAVGSWVGSVLEGVGSIASSIGTAISGLVASIPDKLASIGSAISGIGSAISSFISDKLNSLIGRGGSGQNVPAKYSGQNLHLTSQNSFRGGTKFMDRVLTASGGLWDAAQLEASRMPTGSRLVMANSSELIVPRNQINQVLNGTGTTVNITINTKADQVINDTVAALSEALRRPAMSML